MTTIFSHPSNKVWDELQRTGLETCIFLPQQFCLGKVVMSFGEGSRYWTGWDGDNSRLEFEIEYHRIL